MEKETGGGRKGSEGLRPGGKKKLIDTECDKIRTYRKKSIRILKFGLDHGVV